MEFEISYAGLTDGQYRELAMDVLAAQAPKHYLKPTYRALFTQYVALDIAALVIIFVFALLMGIRSPLPAWPRWAALAALVVLMVPAVLNARLYGAARATWRNYKKTLAEAGVGQILLDDEGIHVSRPDGQKRIFLGWGTLTGGIRSENFVVLHQGRQMAWIVPLRCLEGRLPEFEALLEKHYYSRGLALPEKRA